MDGLYVLNNPWAVQSMEKHTSYCAMMKLGMPIPETWMIPPKAYEPLPDLPRTLKSYAKLFDLTTIGNRIGYPMFMKPYDGGGWRAVTRVKDDASLKKTYEPLPDLQPTLRRYAKLFDLGAVGKALGYPLFMKPYDGGGWVGASKVDEVDQLRAA